MKSVESTFQRLRTVYFWTLATIPVMLGLHVLLDRGGPPDEVRVLGEEVQVPISDDAGLAVLIGLGLVAVAALALGGGLRARFLTPARYEHTAAITWYGCAVIATFGLVHGTLIQAVWPSAVFLALALLGMYRWRPSRDELEAVYRQSQETTAHSSVASR